MAYVKKAIFAVAGAGKTTMLVDSLSLAKRTLLLTYTDNNAENLTTAVVRKFGRIPDNIMISTWFSFVFRFLLKPFEISTAPIITRLIFPQGPLSRFDKGVSRYVSQSGEVFHARAFDFVLNYVGRDKIKNRLTKFFDEILIDEVQDFAGYDFDFIEMLGSTDVDVVLTGDFFQHTYDTSRDGTKNKNLHKDFMSYQTALAKHYQIDRSTLSKSYRCPAVVCDFVHEKIGIDIGSFSCRTDVDDPALLTATEDIQRIMNSDSIMKLFFKEHRQYSCRSANWGQCKGLSFDNVCVVLNKKTFGLFQKGRLNMLAASTLNKFYVACTRTRGNLYFVNESEIADYMVGG